MTDLKTDASLLEALKRAAGRPLSQDEVERQRVSFVIGMLDEKNTMTKEDVRRVLDRHKGETQQ